MKISKLKNLRHMLLVVAVLLTCCFGLSSSGGSVGYKSNNSNNAKWRGQPHNLPLKAEVLTRGATKPKERNDGIRAKPIFMSVYYETLCKDSLHFLESQVLPFLQSADNESLSLHSSSESVRMNLDLKRHPIEELMDITFIPYGKAVTLETPAAASDPFTFICHHGPLECEGNKLHSCALQQRPGSVSALDLTRFFVCTMKFLMNHQADLESESVDSRRPSQQNVTAAALDSCIEELGTTHRAGLHSEIRSCYDSANASFLLARNGDLTVALNPRLNYVPWIMFNGKWSKGKMKQAEADLNRVLCSFLTPKGRVKYDALLHCRQGEGGATNTRKRNVLTREVSPAPGGRSNTQRKHDRRRFLHANDEMEGQLSGWRWRSNYYEGTHHQGGIAPSEWRWRKPVVLQKTQS